MNRLDRPAYDDDAALDALAASRRVGSYPHLQDHVATIKAGYAQYLAANGDVGAVTHVHLPVAIEGYLRDHYGSPPQALEHITAIRVNSDFKTCPMCGSLHSGTLDHVMDKDDHPAFAVFAQNLVPACKCNSKRLKPLVGPNPGERILHPYFDDVLAERIVAATFADLGPVPQVETRIVLPTAHPHFAAAVFHHDSVVMRTAIHGYLRSRWGKLVQQPGIVVPRLKQNPVSRADLVATIEEFRGDTDASRDSRNNWDSVFLTGLLDDHVVDWLIERFEHPGRAPNGSLL